MTDYIDRIRRRLPAGYFELNRGGKTHVENRTTGTQADPTEPSVDAVAGDNAVPGDTPGPQDGIEAGSGNGTPVERDEA
jgi:hypothetical protein